MQKSGLHSASVPNFLKTALLRFSPLAKKILPKWLQRRLLLHVFGINRRYWRMYNAASRVCLERELFPWLAGRYRQILFVGTSSYTYHYEKAFRSDQYTTLEIQPRNAVWGAHHHIVAPVEEIGRHRPRGFFDCIILNGVFGFGVDTPDHMRATIAALAEVLAPGGLLVVGWNSNLHEDPAPLLLASFELATEEPCGRRRTFAPEETHIYEFYRRRKDQ